MNMSVCVPCGDNALCALEKVDMLACFWMPLCGNRPLADQAVSESDLTLTVDQVIDGEQQNLHFLRHHHLDGEHSQKADCLAHEPHASLEDAHESSVCD